MSHSNTYLSITTTCMYMDSVLLESLSFLKLAKSFEALCCISVYRTRVVKDLYLERLSSLGTETYP